MSRFSKLVFLCVLFPLVEVYAQPFTFTSQDTLRGSITPERLWWDVTHYELDITVDPENQFISGTNTITYHVLEKKNQILQLDLQAPLSIEKVTQHGKVLAVRSEGNAHFVNLLKKQRKGRAYKIIVHYKGHPKTAKHAPWDGGISWKKDAHGNPFIASSCQGIGASVWWPNKDHLYDEPDSMDIKVTVPDTLVNISNGKLVTVKTTATSKTYHWKVTNPINNYGVSINIGDYTSFSETYSGENGMLNLNYYILKDHKEQAKAHFKMVPKMLEAFEYWLGPYPFYEDGYKLVETPYLGMEHQSAIAYGNNFQMGYRGRDPSRTGQGLKFDFIIIHESGHEWFGNSISCQDSADLWIHEGFTTYTESLFLEYHYGKKAATEYILGTRKRIRNDRPIIGAYHVNNEGSHDMYIKGANIIHTLRQFAKDDAHWRSILRGINRKFYHQTVHTAAIESYLSKQLKMELTPFFDQYLRTKDIPKLEYYVEQSKLYFRYTQVIPNFEMPLRILHDQEIYWVTPSTTWKSIAILPGNSSTAIKVDPNFYMHTERIAKK